eukprot:7298641-Prymnesium_polylepis.1
MADHHAKQGAALASLRASFSGEASPQAQRADDEDDGEEDEPFQEEEAEAEEEDVQDGKGLMEIASKKRLSFHAPFLDGYRSPPPVERVVQCSPPLSGGAAEAADPTSISPSRKRAMSIRVPGESGSPTRRVSIREPAGSPPGSFRRKSADAS